MKIINTKTNKEFEVTESEFLKKWNEEILAAEERWMTENEKGQKYAAAVAADTTGKYDDTVSPFFDNLKENFNQYGCTWTGPRGVEPIFKIELKESNIDNDDKEVFVVEKPSRFPTKMHWWTLGELKNKAAEIIANYEALPKNWDEVDYVDIVFHDNHSYQLFDPANFKNYEDFVKSVKEFACHSNHNNVDEEAVDLALEMK